MENNTFAKNLAELLDKNGITHKEFGEALGLSELVVRHWVEGKKLPNAGSLKKIVEYFGVSREQMFR